MTNNNVTITRFAPSPTGFLHIGHIASMLFALDYAEKFNGELLLRIEDIDFTRCKNEFTNEIVSDLNWLKIPFRRTKNQSLRKKFYINALKFLKEKDLIYECWLSRSESLKVLSAPHNLSKKNVLKDTDLFLSKSEIQKRKLSGAKPAWRLRMKKSLEYAKLSGEDMSWEDVYCGKFRIEPEKFGDVVIARKDISTSYNLSVTIDDHYDGVTHVTRGDDLFEITHIHRLIQIILSLNKTKWIHHPLILDQNGNRLAKRNKSLSIKSLKKQGFSPDEILSLAREELNKSKK